MILWTEILPRIIIQTQKKKMFQEQYQHLPGTWKEQGLAGTSRKHMVVLPVSRDIVKFGQIILCENKDAFAFASVSYPGSSLHGVIRKIGKLPETGL